MPEEPPIPAEDAREALEEQELLTDNRRNIALNYVDSGEFPTVEEAIEAIKQKSKDVQNAATMDDFNLKKKEMTPDELDLYGQQLKICSKFYGFELNEDSPIAEQINKNKGFLKKLREVLKYLGEKYDSLKEIFKAKSNDPNTSPEKAKETSRLSNLLDVLYKLGLLAGVFVGVEALQNAGVSSSSCDAQKKTVSLESNNNLTFKITKRGYTTKKITGWKYITSDAKKACKCPDDSTDAPDFKGYFSTTAQEDDSSPPTCDDWTYSLNSRGALDIINDLANCAIQAAEGGANILDQIAQFLSKHGFAVALVIVALISIYELENLLALLGIGK